MQLRLAQIFGQQVQRWMCCIELVEGDHELRLHAVQCADMTLARHENTFWRSLPAHHAEQSLAQRRQASASFGRNQYALRLRQQVSTGLVSFIPDVNDRDIFWQFLCQYACQMGVIRYVIYSIITIVIH